MKFANDVIRVAVAVANVCRVRTLTVRFRALETLLTKTNSIAVKCQLLKASSDMPLGNTQSSLLHVTHLLQQKDSDGTNEQSIRRIFSKVQKNPLCLTRSNASMFRYTEGFYFPLHQQIIVEQTMRNTKCQSDVKFGHMV